MLKELGLIIVLTPLLGSLIAGILGRKIGRRASHWVTILGIAVSFVASIDLFKWVVLDGQQFNGPVYTWVLSGSFQFQVGFLLDTLSSIMMLTVTFISLLVHIYSIGYMADDSGYQRFFSYMSAFTFSMLSLVAANNFLLLFFGWEGVGLVSYLLIGFWFKKESAIQGSLKAFLVNRVGDFGFLLGIATILSYFGTIDYKMVFAKAPALANATIMIIPGHAWLAVTVICILLFVGAMGKSAQMPLHVWLPESMEGPTPISALIHAATMVTAGIYMVARMSPLFELSQVALSVVLIVGASGALLMGLVGIVQTDIKRVIAYSTMSQLGYMIAACGASAFAAGMFHLVTHACFKALLFLGAGSVIIALHHEQDLRKMGGLRRYMPITYFTFLVGSLALAAIPPFAGFYSKDAIIDAVSQANIPGATYAYLCLLVGAFVTALYTFRAFFMAFHGKEHMEQEVKAHLHESPGVVIWPLIILAVPSLIIGAALVKPMLYGRWLSSSVYVAAKYNVLQEMAKEFHGIWYTAIRAVMGMPFWFSVAGIATAWVYYLRYPDLPRMFSQKISIIYRVLVYKYGFDAFNQIVFVRGGQLFSNFLYKITDVKIIDDWFINGSGRNVNRMARLLRLFQSGYLYHYALVMIVGLVGFLIWIMLRIKG